MRVAVVVDPVSGKQQGESIAAAAEQRLVAVGHDVSRSQGDDASHSREQLAKVLEAGADTVVVVGGDGALHDLLPVLANSGVPLGLLPAGTGNDAARSLGIPVKDHGAALDVVLDGHVQRIDLAHTDVGDVVTVVASGLDSKVNERANAMTWPGATCAQPGDPRRAARLRARASSRTATASGSGRFR